MKQYSLEIKLLSDLCVSDGGVYNSMIDVDVCHDVYGLPYIPGKRIKGCLRECALELNDWGENIQIEKIFGKSGDRKSGSTVRISDARLENDQILVREIVKGDPVLYHPQNVLGQFTYIRTQTSVDPETGVAKKNSLRTMRVINKGLKFVSDIEADDSVPESQLSDICKCLRNIGLARTRGLGEVECSLRPVNMISKETYNDNAGREKNDYDKEQLLRYEIELEEPVICKSINGGEANSADYIDGSKIIGLLGNRLNDSVELRKYLDAGVKFSNAYITLDGIRALPAGAYLYRIKNDDKYYINKLYFDEEDDEKRQFNVIRNSYVILSQDGSLKIVPVNMEERYHHSRPSDKSIGRATDRDGSKFYQISSISRGQIFTGYIFGTSEQLKEIYDLLKNVKNCYLGYGRGSEYGKCNFRINGYNAPSCIENPVKAKRIVVTLNSPAIVYNDKAMYSVDKKDLLEEILAAIGLDMKTEIKADYFIKYTNCGGYNVTWGARKPVICAFDKGTAVKLEFKEEQEIRIANYMCLGERTTEGYGEFLCEELKEKQSEDQWKYLDPKTISRAAVSLKSDEDDREIGELGSKIYNTLLNGYIREKASALVREYGFNKESYRATVSNLLLICKEQETIEQTEAVVKDRFSKNSANKKDKSDKANRIIKAAKDNYSGIAKEFSEKTKIACVNDVETDELLMKLLQQMLVESKYQIRKTSACKTGKGGEDHE